jgi:putative transposase
LRDAAVNNELAVHAYVLMTNHVHLLVTGKDKSSGPRTIQSVGRRYVAYFNARYSRTGTLWEGRYRSTVVQADEYLLACHRYIDLNPVRAGIARHPADYFWSSYRFYAYGKPNELLMPHERVLAMGTTLERRYAAYRRLFAESLDGRVLEQIRSCSNKGWALGSSDFCDSLEVSAGRRTSSLGLGWTKGKKRGSRPGNKESDPLF